MIPSFRNDVEAAHYADQYKPLQTALEAPNAPSYASRYGHRAAAAAELCRTKILAGDTHGAHIASLALSISLNHDRPNLFDRVKRAA